MRILRYESNGATCWGELAQDGAVAELSDGPGSQRRTGRTHESIAGLTLLPPAEPSKIVAVGLNYRAHAEEVGKGLPSEPLLFLKPPSSLIGQDKAIQLPSETNRIDFEAELAIVIGRRSRHLTPSNWRDAVLGYTCANDITDRTIQKADIQYTRSKSFDTFCPLGPVLVTDLDPSDLEISCTVNGAVKQRSRTSDLIFDIPTLLCFISDVMTLEAGDVVLTGTPSGVGPLAHGDVVEVAVEGIGALRNPVSLPTLQ